MKQSRLYFVICTILWCHLSCEAYSSISSKISFAGVSFVGKIVFSEFILNFASVEGSSQPFFHRMGHPIATSSEESDEDEDENASLGKTELQKPQVTSQNTDQCLAKLLCGMSVAASNKATKPNYFKDYAHLVSRYFQVFGGEDGSFESIEAYDDYSLEEDEPAAPPPKKSSVPEKFDISLGFSSFMSNINTESNNSSNTDDIEPSMSPKAVRNRGAGKLSQRLARAERILADLNRQGRKPQPSHCQSLTGCSYSFKELRAKLKSGAKEQFSSSSSGKAPLRYKVNSTKAKPISSSSSIESNEHFNKGDDELDEIFGSDAFAPAKPKKKTQTPEPPPPPPIYIRRTIIKKKKRPDGTSPNNDEESASTTIIRVAPAPVSQKQPAAAKPVPFQHVHQIIREREPEDKPKRKVEYKKPPKKTKVKDNGDDEDDDINQTLPVKIISSDEYHDDHHKLYNVDNGYQKDSPLIPAKGVSAQVSPAKVNKKKDEDSDEEEDEEEESEEDEENDDEDDDDDSKRRKAPIKISKPSSIVVEDDDTGKKKLADDDEAAEAQKDFWGGLTFVDKKKEREAIKIPKSQKKYKIQKTKAQGGSEEEESKENDDDENSKESKENDDDEEEDTKKVEEPTVIKIDKGKLDIDIPPSSEHDLVFPSRKEKVKAAPSVVKSNNKKKNKKRNKNSSSSEENRSVIITEIGGRPLAPPADVSLNGRTPSAPQASPYKLQFISPYTSKQQSSSYSAPPTHFGGNVKKPEKLQPITAPLTSHAFLKSNLPTNNENANSQGKPDMFSRISHLSPLSSITNFFRKGPKANSQDAAHENHPPPISSFMKRPVGPESSKYRRAPNRDKKKNKF